MSVLGKSFNPTLACLTWGSPHRFASLTDSARSQSIATLQRVESLLERAIRGDIEAFGRLNREFGPEVATNKHRAIDECRELLRQIDYSEEARV